MPHASFFSVVQRSAGGRSGGPDGPPPQAGDWVIAGTGNVLDNATVILNGNLKITTGTLLMDNATLIFNCTSNGQYGLDVGPAGTLSVQNSTITSASGVNHFKFLASGNLTMDDSTVRECWGDPALVNLYSGLAISCSATLRGCRIENSSGSGMSIFNASCPRISNCTVTSPARHGILCFGTSSPRIEDTTVRGSGRHGFGAGDSSSPTYTKCTALNCTLSGFIGSGSPKMTLVECTASGNGESGVLAAIDTTLYVSDSFFQANGLTGLGAINGSLCFARDILAAGNLNHGYVSQGTSKVILDRCNASGNKNAGFICTDNATSDWLDCTGIANKNVSFEMSNWSRTNLTRCTGDGGFFAAFLMRHNSTAVFSNCTARDSNVNGYSFWGGSIGQLVDCKAINCSSDGYSITTNSNITLDRCLAQRCQEDGFLVGDTARARFDDCVADRNDFNGLLCTSDLEVSVSDFTVAQNRMFGVYIHGKGSVNLSRVYVSQSGAAGMYFDGTGPSSVVDCTATDSNTTALSVSMNARPVFDGCVFSDSRLGGVLSSGTAAPTFQNCTIRNNAHDGVQTTDYSSPVFWDCSVLFNGRNGLRASDNSTPTLVRCDLSANTQSGLCISGTAPTVLERLLLSSNGVDNLRVDGKVRLTLANSTTGNAVTDITLTGGAALDVVNGKVDTDRLYITPDSVFRLRWLVSFKVLDGTMRPCAGALVRATGSNDSASGPAPTNASGRTGDIAVSEFTQNGPLRKQHNPYRMNVTMGPEFNLSAPQSFLAPAVRTVFLDFAPTVAHIPDLSVVEDSETVLDVGPYLGDPDGQTSELVVSPLDERARAEGTLLLINCTTECGNFPLEFTVSDGWRNTTAAVNVSVNAVNDRPVLIQKVPDFTAREDSSLAINLSGYFHDEENGSYLDYSGSDARFSIDMDNLTASITGMAGQSLIEGLMLSASDGDNSVTSNIFRITVTPVNDPPVYTGGLSGAVVGEHGTWTVDLDNFFSDEENPELLTYMSSSPEINIDPLTHRATWKPLGENHFVITVNFTATDGQDRNLVAFSPDLELRYVPQNDPPVYRGGLGKVRLKFGEEWNVTLEDCFEDEEGAPLRFESSSPDIRIIAICATRHYAFWKPGLNNANITTAFIRAFDGSNWTASPNFSLTFDFPQDTTPRWQRELVAYTPWFVYGLLPACVIGGVAGYYLYRRVRYGKYRVEQAFLVYNDGRLLAHRSRGEKEGNEDLVGGMLTALQSFIKDSMKGAGDGSLDEVKYGDLKIAIERGARTYLALFISGYITDALRSLMKETVNGIEKDFGDTLKNWDGVMSDVEKTGKYLDTLMEKRK